MKMDLSREEIEKDITQYSQALRDLRSELRIVRMESSMGGVIEYLQRKLLAMDQAEVVGQTQPTPPKNTIGKNFGE